MDFDCGRMGNLEGVFIADTEDVEYLVNNKISVYFGEVLGSLAPIVLEQALKESGTQLLEPYLSFILYAPQEYETRMTSKLSLF